MSRLIAVLDEFDGDPEAEPWLGGPDVSACVPQRPRAANDDREQDAGDDRELEDEHGGDINDEPHDAESD